MRICVACGKTDDEVHFNKINRSNGTVYTHIRCGECQWKRRTRVENGTAVAITRPGMAHMNKLAVVEVLKCPHNEYPRGNRFSGGDFKTTLKGGAWTLGMIVRIKGVKYAVCGNGVVMRTLKRRGYPLGVKLPAQWLAEV